MDNQNNKKIFLTVMFVAILSIAVIGTSFAFFNYTRTGSANTVRTGRISFSTSQETILLENIFPISSEQAETDTTNAKTIAINVVGDTDYDKGIEYLVTATDVNIETLNNKKLPITLDITVDGNGLGELDNSYYENRESYRDSKYKIAYNGKLEDDAHILVGYIGPNVNKGNIEGINGTINIKAYVNSEDILITDTLEGVNEETGYTNGTTNTNNKTVFTTEEWNNIGSNSLSFKIKVEANEGIWVKEQLTRNDMINFYSANTFTTEQKQSITEINFIRMSEEEINTHANLIDLKDPNGEGIVKGWIENNKLYIASPGETYFPVDSSNLFNGYSNVVNINFNNINTNEVTKMNGLFAFCNNLENIDLSNFDTSEVTNMYIMFLYCNKLSNLDLSSFDTSNVTIMGAMFNGCSSLVNLDLSSFNTTNVTEMGSMFNGCSSLTNINLDNWNLESLSSLGAASGLLGGCNSLKNISCKNWILPSDCSDWWFRYANGFNSSIESIDVTGWDLSNTTNIRGLFADGTSSFTTIIGLETWDTSNITNMSQLFYGCTALTKLDLSKWNTSNVNDMSLMFRGMTNLTTIYVGDNWSTSSVTNSSDMFKDSSSLIGGNGTVFDSSKIDKTMAVVDTVSTPGYLTMKTNESTYTTNAINRLPKTGSFDSTVRGNVKEIRFIKMDSSSMDTKYNAASIKQDMTYNNEGRVLTWLEDTTDSKYIMYIASDGITYFTTGNQLFMDYQNVEKIIFTNINTERVTDMAYMFYHLTKLNNLDVSRFNTSNVTTVDQMFQDCTSLSRIDVSNFKFDSLERMSRFLSGCTSLTSINLGNIGGNNIITVEYAFQGDTNLKEINMSNFNFGKTTNVGRLFAGVTNVESINLSGAKFYTSMDNLFSNDGAGLTHLTSVNLSNIDTGNITNMHSMFEDNTELEEIDLSSFDTRSVTNVSNMFRGCTKLKTIYAGNKWNLENALDNDDMFTGDTLLVGGNGTVYDSSKTDKEYARIDTSTTPGYLTSK